MVPETIVGQLRPDMTENVAQCYNIRKRSILRFGKVRFAMLEYEAVMEQRKDVSLTLDLEDGTSDVLSGAEIYKLIFDSNNRGC